MPFARTDRSPLRKSHLKLLALIHNLDEMGYMANADGLVEVVNGSYQEEKGPSVSSLDVYASVSSLNKKRGKGLLRYLLRHDYVSRAYNPEEDEYYFRLTPSGEEAAVCYLSKPQKKAEKPATKKSKRMIIPKFGQGEKHEH